MAIQSRAAGEGEGRFGRRVWLPLGLMALIYFASSRPIPATGAGQLDKLVHVLVFAILAGAWIFALSPTSMSRGRRIVLAALLSILWGITDEWHQSFVPGRVASVADALADVVGASACGVLVFWMGRSGPRGDGPGGSRDGATRSAGRGG